MIGIVDSGVGGLEVLRRLERLLPAETFLYLADTARHPYGERSPQDLRDIARDAIGRLGRLGAKAVVLACNTLSAYVGAVDAPVPVVGVIDPAAQLAASAGGRVLVLASEAAVRSGAHARAIHGICPGITVTAVPCPGLIARVEFGASDESTVAECSRLFGDLFRRSDHDAVLLGCTHLSLIRLAIAATLPPRVHLLDPAGAIAEAVVSRVGGGRRRDAVRWITTGDPDVFMSRARRYRPVVGSAERAL